MSREGTPQCDGQRSEVGGWRFEGDSWRLRVGLDDGVARLSRMLEALNHVSEERSVVICGRDHRS
jgi:hypothetical protein